MGEETGPPNQRGVRAKTGPKKREGGLGIDRLLTTYVQYPSGPPDTGSRPATSSVRSRSAGSLDSQSTISPVRGCLNNKFAAWRNCRVRPSLLPEVVPPYTG